MPQRKINFRHYDTIDPTRLTVVFLGQSFFSRMLSLWQKTDFSVNLENPKFANVLLRNGTWVMAHLCIIGYLPRLRSRETDTI